MIWPVPFEEDAKDPEIWFLDHNFHEQMHSMFKKVNGKLFLPHGSEFTIAQHAKMSLVGTALARKYAHRTWLLPN
jgi:hypothetical protein